MIENIDAQMRKVSTVVADEQRKQIRDAILDVTMESRGFAVHGALRRVLEPVATPLLNTFVEMIADADRHIAKNSFYAAARRLLYRFARSVEVLGVENIPEQGPVLLLSNHPGAFDEVVIAALVKRRDLRVFANDHPILTSFPHISDHAVYSGLSDAHQRMAGLRTAVKFLRSGGIMLIYPAGRTEPDPRLTPGAYDAFANWSPSIELLIEKTPNLRVVVTMVSGVVSSGLLHSGLLNFQPNPLERQKLATSIQVGLQFGFPRLFTIVPRVTFGPAQTIDELTFGGSVSIHDAVIARARQMLPLHAPNAPALPLEQIPQPARRMHE